MKNSVADTLSYTVFNELKPGLEFQGTDQSVYIYMQSVNWCTDHIHH